MEITPLVRKLVAIAIEEDLLFGDITASLSVPADRASSAKVIARQSLVVCGLDIAQAVIEVGGWAVSVHKKCVEGAVVNEGEVLLELSGPTRGLLAAERTILNFLQRLCGVATHTHQICASSKGVTLLDTRKTMPGWRFLDKYAVRVGGARNHRFSLGDMILVKNNHIDAHPDGMRGALASVVRGKPLYMPWEVEVRSLDELLIALEFSPTIVMLDNFSDDHISEAMKVVVARSSRPLVEVSGGVTKERLALLSTLGVDAVSMGALTTQAPNVDISMRIG
jgi:nicotinate-nucleotide pyrophosphorylase (carboxylating)